MATFERPKQADGVPLDLLPVIRNSGVLSEKISGRDQDQGPPGGLPHGVGRPGRTPGARNILTSYQAKRFLNNRSHGLIVGRYIILDRIGSGSMDASTRPIMS